MNRKTAFYLITDAHYVSPQTWVEGEPITRRERGDQIALKATPQILDTFLETVLADDEADTVIFTGDNINGGDVQSHLEFRERLERLAKAGKKVYVTAATHDYCGDGEDGNTFSACRYTETGTEPIPFLRKGELFDFYFEYGAKQARSVHRESGSYTVKLCDGVRLAMIVDNGDGRQHCGLFADGMQWLRSELQTAKAAGEYVLLAVHHPVLPPWEVFRHMAEFELYGGYRELCAMMCEENVRVVFTGHTHVQSIRQYTDAQNRSFFDVSTIALANAAGKMRRVTVDADAGVCDVQSVGITDLHGVDTHGLSAYDVLRPLNFPGILEKLIPLGARDFGTFLELADGLLPTDKLKRHPHLIKTVCKKAERLTLAFPARFGGTWHTLSKAQKQSAKSTSLADVVFTVLRHIYPGNAPYTPDTVEYVVLEGAARRLDAVVQTFHIDTLQKLIPPGSSISEMLEDFLYNNRTGDDDAIRFSLSTGGIL